MPSTLMNDTNMTDAWIEEMTEAVPMQFAQDGSDEILTGLVRLSFPKLFKPEITDRGERYSTAMLFPLNAPLGLLTEANADLGAINERGWALIEERFPKQIRNGEPARTLKTAVREQDEHTRSGFTPGGYYLNAAATRKPAIVDIDGNPVTDPSALLPGYWAICTVTLYTFDKDANKGVTAGLGSVMVVAEDQVLGGSGLPPSRAFARAKVPAKLRRPNDAAKAKAAAGRGRRASDDLDQDELD